jgi:hypothetical protein
VALNQQMTIPFKWKRGSDNYYLTKVSFFIHKEIGSIKTVWFVSDRVLYVSLILRNCWSDN